MYYGLVLLIQESCISIILYFGTLRLFVGGFCLPKDAGEAKGFHINQRRIPGFVESEIPKKLQNQKQRVPRALVAFIDRQEHAGSALRTGKGQQFQGSGECGKEGSAHPTIL